MNLETLCDKIELQQEIKTQVLEFVNNFNFQDEIQKGYFIYQNMKDALDKTRSLLGEDLDGIKILSCMLKETLHTYEIYKEKEIPEKIFFDTMKCFTRFINETFKMTGKLSFDRYWWTTRQVGCHLFRIGELEYEIKQAEENTYISLHIPSDADFSPNAVDKSLSEAKKFFEKFYSELKDAEYRCHSWLLDNQLKSMLKENSNIIHFQNRFEIFNEGEIDFEFIEWVFNTKSKDFTTLTEKTSLQKKLKQHLLSGGVIRNSHGRMKNNTRNILNYAKNNLHKLSEIGISSNKIHLFEYNEKKYISKTPLMIGDNLSPFWIMMKNIFSFTFEKQISQLKNLYSTLKENPHIPFAPFVISDKNIMIYEFVEGESFDSDEFPKGDNNAYKLGKFIGYNHQTSHKNCGIIGIEDINNFSQKLFSHMRECIKLHWNTNSLIDKKVNQYFNLLSKNDFTSNKFSLTMIDISADQFLYKKENIICCVDLDAYVIGPVEWELTFLKNQIEDWQSFKSGYETYQPIPEFEKSSKLFLFLMALNSYHDKTEMENFLNIQTQ